MVVNNGNSRYAKYVKGDLEPVEDRGDAMLVLKSYLELKGNSEKGRSDLKGSSLEERNEDEEDKIVPFQVVTGGKGPPDFPWILTLPDQSIFLARATAPSPIRYNLEQFKIICRTYLNKGMLLNYGFGDGFYQWVDPVEFSKAFELFEVRRYGEGIHHD